MIEIVNTDDLHDHNNDFLLSHIKWHIKCEVMTPVANPLTIMTNWRSFDLAMTENMTSDDPHDHNNEFNFSYPMSSDLSNEM